MAALSHDVDPIRAAIKPLQGKCANSTLLAATEPLKASTTRDDDTLSSSDSDDATDTSPRDPMDHLCHCFAELSNLNIPSMVTTFESDSDDDDHIAVHTVTRSRRCSQRGESPSTRPNYSDARHHSSTTKWKPSSQPQVTKGKSVTSSDRPQSDVDKILPLGKFSDDLPTAQLLPVPSGKRSPGRRFSIKKPDYARLRPYFLLVDVEKVQRTFQASTQFATNVVAGNIIQQSIKSPFPAHNVFRQNEPVASDMIFAEVPAIDTPGYTMAQFFAGRKLLVCNIFGMTTTREFVNTLEDIIRKRGVMDKLITDSARVEISG